jgi:hypothetical protein
VAPDDPLFEPPLFELVPDVPDVELPPLPPVLPMRGAGSGSRGRICV